MTLYVDVDDTLVKWRTPPQNAEQSFRSTDWDFNEKIVNVMLEALEQNQNVVVWSGGGANYAELWVARLENWLGRKLRITGEAKTLYTLGLVTDEDTVIDDSSLRITAGTFIQAQAFD